MIKVLELIYRVGQIYGLSRSLLVHLNATIKIVDLLLFIDENNGVDALDDEL